MPEPGQNHGVRRAKRRDAGEIGRMLFDFNLEFGAPTPDAAFFEKRLEWLLKRDEAIAVIGGEGPDGFAILRLRPSLYSDGGHAYLEELYVKPASRRVGLGRALLEAALELAREHGCESIDLATGEDDTAARALYEALGFSNREDTRSAPAMLFYERAL